MIEFEIRFFDRDSFDRVAREGWGGSEPMGAWMTGQSSRLVLPPPPRHDGPFELRGLVSPMIRPGRVDVQRMRILVNGTEVFNTRMDRLYYIGCPIPAEVIAARPHVEIVFEHPDAACPSELGEGDDLRTLAASVWNMTLLGDTPLPAERAPVFSPPVFLTRPRGNLANRMIQHMVALSVQSLATNCVLSGMELDEWGIRTAPDDGTWADLALVDEQRIDIAGTAELLASQTVRKIVHRGYGQRLENLMPRERYAGVFVSDEGGITVYDRRHLLINVRSGDVVEGRFRDYVLTPIAFYRDVIADTGLIPVFMGQLEPNPYTDALRAAFPHALFHPSQGAIRDFETVRRAANIVVAVSTFSWLAAWLSEAEQVFLPVNGLFNPLQFPACNLVPLNDPRYRFYLFPINHAAPDFETAHRAIEGQWRRVDAAELTEIFANAVVAAEDEPQAAAAAPPPAGEPTPMYEDVRAILAEAEAAAEHGYAIDVLQHLRKLWLNDYAELMWSLPRADLPGISRLLPAMAPEDVQLGWNGRSGPDLRNHSIDFCHILAQRFQQICNRPLDHVRVLDFGCGWGRLLRMFYWYTDPQLCCGVDAMPQAIDRCRTDGVLGRLVQSNYIAEDLDVGDRRYDLIVAYSVFTHTPLRVAQVALATLHRKLRPTGMLAITVRSAEFWERNGLEQSRAATLVAAHRSEGFAYMPLGVTAPNGEDIYGETSMSPAWLAANFPAWEVEGCARGADPMQMIVFLTPR